VATLHRCYWSGREDSNLRPLGPKSQVRQNVKFLAFSKVAATTSLLGFCGFFPFAISQYPRCAENSVHKLATRFWGEPLH
jgi:hypothetical protein